MKIRNVFFMGIALANLSATPVRADSDACDAINDSGNSCNSVPTLTTCGDYEGSSYCWDEPDYQWYYDCLDQFYDLYYECQEIQEEQNQPQMPSPDPSPVPPQMPSPDPYPNGDGPTPWDPSDDECPPDYSFPNPSGPQQIACNNSYYDYEYDYCYYEGDC